MTASRPSYAPSSPRRCLPATQRLRLRLRHRARRDWPDKKLLNERRQLLAALDDGILNSHGLRPWSRTTTRRSREGDMPAAEFDGAEPGQPTLTRRIRAGISSVAMVSPRACIIAAIVLALTFAAISFAPAAPGPLGAIAEAHPEPGDVDGDGVGDAADNCVTTPNGSQLNKDGDAEGDACDADDDGDAVPDATDNCRLVANPGQEDTIAGDGGRGDACPAVDTDGDGRFDDEDNCLGVSNPDQRDLDGDDKGDACDRDDDGDRYDDGFDNCPVVYNPDQADADGDAIGSACDADELIAGAATPVAPAAATDLRPLSATLRVQRRQRLSETGPVIVVTVSCSKSCTLDAAVSATAQAVRRAGLGRARLVLARGTWSLAGAGRTYVFARWTPAARRLRAGRTVAATLQLTATDAAGTRSRLSRRVELRR